MKKRPWLVHQKYPFNFSLNLTHQKIQLSYFHVYQVQLMSHRLKDTVYIVEDGQAQPLQLQGPDVMSDYIRIPKEESDDVQPIDDRQQISPTGYM